jgi:hypothetical protein
MSTFNSKRYTHGQSAENCLPGKSALVPESPATEKQKKLLRLAIDKKWLAPNPFIQNYSKWENLTAAEADKLLASIPPERLGILERELKEKSRNLRNEHTIARSIGRGIEDELKQFGHTIDGGL